MNIDEEKEKYIEENRNNFDKETEIKIIQNENIDLENWLKSIYKLYHVTRKISITTKNSHNMATFGGLVAYSTVTTATMPW